MLRTDSTRLLNCSGAHRLLLALLLWPLTGVAQDSRENRASPVTEYDTPAPAGLSCLNGEPDFPHANADANEVSDVCYATDAFFVIQRQTSAGEGYTLSLKYPADFTTRTCSVVDSKISNCINVVPGKSRAYVEAALGVEAPADVNRYRWQDTQGTSTELTLSINENVLSAMDVLVRIENKPQQ